MKEIPVNSYNVFKDGVRLHNAKGCTHNCVHFFIPGNCTLFIENDVKGGVANFEICKNNVTNLIIIRFCPSRELGTALFPFAASWEYHWPVTVVGGTVAKNREIELG